MNDSKIRASGTVAHRMTADLPRTSLFCISWYRRHLLVAFRSTIFCFVRDTNGKSDRLLAAAYHSIDASSGRMSTMVKPGWLAL